jgi:hypothetical protein
MGKTNERLEVTRQAIEQALHDSHGYQNLRRSDGWLPVRVYFGEADCCVTAAFGGSFGARMELLVGVPADWLERVLAPGLALVNGAVVLQATPVPWDAPAEETWEAWVMIRGYDHEGVELSCQFIVRFGGETNRGQTLELAREWCLLNIRERLGI